MKLKRRSSGGVMEKRCFLKFHKIHRKMACLRPATLLKKRLWNRCFPVNFAKFLDTPFPIEHLRLLLLKLWLYFYHIQPSALEGNLTMWPPFLHPSKKTFLSLLIWPRSEYTWTLNSKQSLLIHFEIWCSLFSRVGIGWWTLL